MREPEEHLEPECTIVPHDHGWQRRQWGYVARCSGAWYCLTCGRYFTGPRRWRCDLAYPDRPAGT